jgi:hypothetical protein
MRAAEDTVQVIDGVFEAYSPNAKTPWLRLEAIDSSYWEAWTEDPGVLDAFKHTFKDVEELSDPAA